MPKIGNGNDNAEKTKDQLYLIFLKSGSFIFMKFFGGSKVDFTFHLMVYIWELILVLLRFGRLKSPAIYSILCYEATKI
jgi:hypothetical protein